MFLILMKQLVDKYLKRFYQWINPSGNWPKIVYKNLPILFLNYFIVVVISHFASNWNFYVNKAKFSVLKFLSSELLHQNQSQLEIN